MRVLRVAIIGYGAPEDPKTDGNLMGYLDPITRFLRGHHGVTALYLLGGYTNRPDLSEAAAMHQWIQFHEARDIAEDIVLVETTRTARENIEALARLSYPGDHIIIFCEHSRRWIVRMLVRHFLRERSVRVVGIAFDEPSLTLRHRLHQAGPRLALEWIALHSGRMDRVRLDLRELHINRARAHD